MYLNRELPRSGLQPFQPCATVRPAKRAPEVPQITIRGDNNLINVGASGVVTVSSGAADGSSLPSVRSRHWPQQILDAIRLKAAKSRRSNDQICEVAGRVLGRPIVTLERLSTRELARVYEAVCAIESNSR